MNFQDRRMSHYLKDYRVMLQPIISPNRHVAVIVVKELSNHLMV